MSHVLTLSLLPGRLAVCRLSSQDQIPKGLDTLPLYSLTRTDEELSLVVPETAIPETTPARTGFRALRVSGPLDFALTGVLVALLTPLAAAGIPVFTLSTFDTDIILVREENLDLAASVLQQAGHSVCNQLG